jgi:hypothetical protein
MDLLNLSRLSDWIVVTPLSVYLQNVKSLIPVLQSVHLVAMAVVLSSCAIVDLRLLGVISKDQTLTAVARRFLRPTWVALALMLLTGTILIVAEPARSLTAFPFQLKVMLILAAVAVTAGQQHFVSANAPGWDTALALPPAARIAAAVSILLWLAIIVCGRWIAYA